MSYKKTAAMICILPFVLCGCESFKGATGISKTPPDEFSIDQSRKPLDVPPNFNDLPSPDGKKGPASPTRDNSTGAMTQEENNLLKKLPGGTSR